MKWRREKQEPDEEFPIIMELNWDKKSSYMSFVVHWPGGGGYSWRSNLREFIQSWEKQSHIARFDPEILDMLIHHGHEQWPDDDLASVVPQNWKALSIIPKLADLYQQASNNQSLSTENKIAISDDVHCCIHQSGLEIDLLFLADGQLLSKHKPNIIVPRFLVFHQQLFVFHKKLNIFNRHGEVVSGEIQWGIDEGWIEIENMRLCQDRLIAYYRNKIPGPRRPMKETFHISSKYGWIEFDKEGKPCGFCPQE